MIKHFTSNLCIFLAVFGVAIIYPTTGFLLNELKVLSQKHTLPYLEDHPRTDVDAWGKKTMVSFRPLRIGLWDPFQMAYIHGL